MDLHYATTNKGKVETLRQTLTPLGVNVVQSSLDIPEPRSSDVAEIAAAKIEAAYREIKKPVVVLDAGFYVHMLNGFPRAFVNFALETVDLDGMLALARGEEAACEFRECLAYMDDSMEQPEFFTSHVPGRLALSKRGTLQPHHWSRLALIFIPEGMDKTLAELTPEEYTRWRESAKGQSNSRALGEWLSKKGKL